MSSRGAGGPSARLPRWVRSIAVAPVRVRSLRSGAALHAALPTRQLNGQDQPPRPSVANGSKTTSSRAAKEAGGTTQYTNTTQRDRKQHAAAYETRARRPLEPAADARRSPAPTLTRSPRSLLPSPLLRCIADSPPCLMSTPRSPSGTAPRGATSSSQSQQQRAALAQLSDAHASLAALSSSLGQAPPTPRSNAASPSRVYAHAHATAAPSSTAEDLQTSIIHQQSQLIAKLLHEKALLTEENARNRRQLSGMDERLQRLLDVQQRRAEGDINAQLAPAPAPSAASSFFASDVDPLSLPSLTPHAYDTSQILLIAEYNVRLLQELQGLAAILAYFFVQIEEAQGILEPALAKATVTHQQIPLEKVAALLRELGGALLEAHQNRADSSVVQGRPYGAFAPDAAPLPIPIETVIQHYMQLPAVKEIVSMNLADLEVNASPEVAQAAEEHRIAQRQLEQLFAPQAQLTRNQPLSSMGGYSTGASSPSVSAVDAATLNAITSAAANAAVQHAAEQERLRQQLAALQAENNTLRSSVQAATQAADTERQRVAQLERAAEEEGDRERKFAQTISGFLAPLAPQRTSGDDDPASSSSIAAAAAAAVPVILGHAPAGKEKDDPSAWAARRRLYVEQEQKLVALLTSIQTTHAAEEAASKGKPAKPLDLSSIPLNQLQVQHACLQALQAETESKRASANARCHRLAEEKAALLKSAAEFDEERAALHAEIARLSKAVSTEGSVYATQLRFVEQQREQLALKILTATDREKRERMNLIRQMRVENTAAPSSARKAASKKKQALLRSSSTERKKAAQAPADANEHSDLGSAAHRASSISPRRHAPQPHPSPDSSRPQQPFSGENEYERTQLRPHHTHPDLFRDEPDHLPSPSQQQQEHGSFMQDHAREMQLIEQQEQQHSASATPAGATPASSDRNYSGPPAARPASAFQSSFVATGHKPATPQPQPRPSSAAGKSASARKPAMATPTRSKTPTRHAASAAKPPLSTSQLFASPMQASSAAQSSVSSPARSRAQSATHVAPFVSSSLNAQAAPAADSSSTANAASVSPGPGSVIGVRGRPRVGPTSAASAMARRSPSTSPTPSPLIHTLKSTPAPTPSITETIEARNQLAAYKMTGSPPSTPLNPVFHDAYNLPPSAMRGTATPSTSALPHTHQDRYVIVDATKRTSYLHHRQSMPMAHAQRNQSLVGMTAPNLNPYAQVQLAVPLLTSPEVPYEPAGFGTMPLPGATARAPTLQFGDQQLSAHSSLHTQTTLLTHQYNFPDQRTRPLIRQNTVLADRALKGQRDERFFVLGGSSGAPGFRNLPPRIDARWTEQEVLQHALIAEQYVEQTHAPLQTTQPGLIMPPTASEAPPPQQLLMPPAPNSAASAEPDSY